MSIFAFERFCLIVPTFSYNIGKPGLTFSLNENSGLNLARAVKKCTNC